ncbi:DNA ligase-like protein [Parasponia andersonii]|uniref:DNA ligase-like protein n=1 Tax=Parasponia andersonii TaxID=3476 RepID=A0A2P5AVH1_PARAD|nr:DNA ligase-like protein [Parasponia andersonii]
MESDNDALQFSTPEGASPPVPRRKLKRLKKAFRVSSQDLQLKQSEDGTSMAEASSSKFETLEFEGSGELLSSSSGSEVFDRGSGLDSGFSGLGSEEDGSGVKRALDFGNFVEGSGGDRTAEVREGSVDVSMEEMEKKRPSSDFIEEEKKKEKKKRKKRVESGGDEKTKETSNKRRSEKERRDNLKQLHADSQRLLRETRDATFKPAPLVQKPISSVLEKIRQRKLEVAKKSALTKGISFIDDSDDFPREVFVNQDTEGTRVNDREENRVPATSNEEKIASGTEAEGSIDGMCKDESNDSIVHSSGNIPQMVMNKGSEPSFRVPIDDTQDLFSDSQSSDSKNEMPSSPLEEVFVSSVLAMNLQLDSAPPDDISSDEEDNDKENIDPGPSGSADLASSPIVDPVKAFVDEEAEEEDDSDNDLLRFNDNDEDEDDEDLEELKDMIATGYEEKPIDSERRNELHQKWLEQQDAAGTENLLQKLNYGSKLREPTLIEEKEDIEGEEDEEFGDEAPEELAPSNLVKMNLKKVKQMIPQMFTDNNDAYLSDDEEAEKRLAKQCLLEKADEQFTFLSPAEDESSREVFGLIKKLNLVPDAKKRAKTHTYFDLSHLGVNRNISSKSSFLGRGSSHLPSSKRQGSTTARSFIFERDDSNSSSTITASEDLSETIRRENRPRVASVKFSNSQIRTTQISSPVMKPDTSLLDILKRTSVTSKCCTLDSVVTQTESMLASFKLAKKPVKTNEDRNL